MSKVRMGKKGSPFLYNKTAKSINLDLFYILIYGIGFGKGHVPFQFSYFPDISVVRHLPLKKTCQTINTKELVVSCPIARTHLC